MQDILYKAAFKEYEKFVVNKLNFLRFFNLGQSTKREELRL